MDRRHWLKAFPIQEASKAVEVVLDGWKDLSSRNSAKFCHTEKEPKLTTMLRLYIKDYKAMNAGLLGQWGAEQTEGMLDLITLEITKRHRTDIHYAWHDQSTRHEIIFEFKKLSHTKSSRDLYYSKEGMGRFIDGNYAKRHPLSLMVGILMSAKEDCVPPLKKAISANGAAGALKMLKNSKGHLLTEPSDFFNSKAEFDTEHTRPVEMAPQHGSIIISHLFVEFPFPNKSKKSIRKNLVREIEQ